MTLEEAIKLAKYRKYLWEKNIYIIQLKEGDFITSTDINLKHFINYGGKLFHTEYYFPEIEKLK